MQASSTTFCLPSLRPLTRAIVALGILGSAAACGQSSLHPSFGQRLSAVQAAQLAAHPAREPVVRGDEASRNVALYYSTLDATTQGGTTGGAQASGGGMPTAGVMPMH